MEFSYKEMADYIGEDAYYILRNEVQCSKIVGVNIMHEHPQRNKVYYFFKLQGDVESKGYRELRKEKVFLTKQALLDSL